MVGNYLAQHRKRAKSLPEKSHRFHDHDRRSLKKE